MASLSESLATDKEHTTVCPNTLFLSGLVRFSASSCWLLLDTSMPHMMSPGVAPLIPLSVGVSMRMNASYNICSLYSGVLCCTASVRGKLKESRESCLDLL